MAEFTSAVKNRTPDYEPPPEESSDPTVSGSSHCTHNLVLPTTHYSQEFRTEKERQTATTSAPTAAAAAAAAVCKTRPRKGKREMWE